MKESDKQNLEPSLNFVLKISGFMCRMTDTMIAWAVRRLIGELHSHRNSSRHFIVAITSGYDD